MRNFTLNIIRFISLFLLQVLLFKEFRFGWGTEDYVHIFVYPLFIILLPTNSPRWAQLILAFILGLMVDQFYNSPGVHASALVFTAFIRLIILRLMEPPEKYPLNGNISMATMSFNWFATYLGILLFIHLFFYFSVEAFSFKYFLIILIKTILSWLATFIIAIIVLSIGSLGINQKNSRSVRRI